MAAGDLTTRTAVRAFLQKQAADTAQDTLIDTLITAASKAIQKDTYIMQPAETAAAKVFTWHSQGLLCLSPYYCRSVTSVVFDAGTSYQASAVAGDWELHPDPAEVGAYTHLRLFPHEVTLSTLDRYNQSYLDSLRRKVTVTGNWGLSAVPEDVAHWANVTVAIWLRRDVSAFSTTFNLEDERLERPEALPSAVRAGLQAYAREPDRATV